MAYTPIDKPTDYFNTKLYTGTGSTLNITGVGFQPDLVWTKLRDTTAEGNMDHALVDSVRGVTKTLRSNTSAAEGTEANSLTAFGSDGYTVGNNGKFNYSSSDIYVSWNWKAGTSFTNDASATGIGSIDSTGSVNTDAGFSIMSYTGTGSTGTVAHGLGVAPSFLIYKNRASTDSWNVQSDGLTSYDYYLRLNSTGAQNNDIDVGPTAPTSTVVTVGSHAQQNGSSNAMILYAFAEKQGYSKFGSYTGNGNADGTFVYTGFKPAFVMVKQTTVRYWAMFDNKRDGFNPTNRPLFPNAADQESDSVNYYYDILSNGFKWRTNTTIMNESGGSYIYMAFAENPFVTSTGVPACAR